MIAVRGLTKRFGGSATGAFALNAVDLEIPDGCFFVLLGPSGSGKTTLLRCVAGLENPDGGDIQLGSELVFSSARRLIVRPEYRALGMVFQSYAIWPHLTVYENVVLPLRYGVQRIAVGERDKRVMEALARVRLDHLKDRPAPLLSGGQQQRIALARALAARPKALLMDEPLSNLDTRLREDIRGEIRAVVRDIGMTVLYVTHDKSDAMTLGDRVGVMADGKIAQIGSAEELYARPATVQVAELFGAMNWISGQVHRSGIVTTPIGDLAASPKGTESRVRVGVRPEDIRLKVADEGESGGTLGQIVDLTFYGDHYRCTVDIRGERLRVSTAAPDIASLHGKSAKVTVSAERFHVFAAD